MRQVEQNHDRQPRLAGPSAELLRTAVRHPFDTGRNVGPDAPISFGSESGIELQYPSRLVWPSPWVGHIPFAFWLVEAVRPRVIVELGVHSGNSYCAFLEAVQSLGLPTQCYGIDHWRGDDHADQYGEDVYTDLCSYHSARYATFSMLMRTTFEDAVPYFSDGTVDLLHIDGFHTYEAVAKDFSEWLPKVSARGVVLFHDINVRERGFGVWRFWEEIAGRYPTLAFAHSHGLGLAYVGTEPQPSPLEALLASADSEAGTRFRSYFARLGASIVDRFERHQAEQAATHARAGEAELEAARSDSLRQAEKVETLRLEVERASAQLAVLKDELAAERARAARATEAAASFHRALSTSRAEAAREAESVGRLEQLLSESRAETARTSEVSARLQSELSAVRAEAARQAESVLRLQQEVSLARSETARLADDAVALQRQYSEARSELDRQAEVVAGAGLYAQQAAAQRASLEAELAEARAEVARHLEATERARAVAEEATRQATALSDELVRTRDRATQSLEQRERAAQLLRRQIATTMRLQSELATRVPNPAVAAQGDRQTTTEQVIKGPVRRFVRKRVTRVDE